MNDPTSSAPDVSRETQSKLDRYAALIRRWNPAINIVAPDSIGEITSRHIDDCRQILQYVGHPSKWIDLGAGGGLPGVVVAICTPNPLDLTLVESDRRKCEFLRTARRELSLNFKIKSVRIEEIESDGYDVVSARALAPLDKLLSLSHRFAGPDTKFLFLKGAKWREEVAQAEQAWRFNVSAHQSVSHTDAAVLEITDVGKLADEG